MSVDPHQHHHLGGKIRLTAAVRQWPRQRLETTAPAGLLTDRPIRDQTCTGIETLLTDHIGDQKHGGRHKGGMGQIHNGCGNGISLKVPITASRVPTETTTM
jgi:hypothetical protein